MTIEMSTESSRFAPSCRLPRRRIFCTRPATRIPRVAPRAQRDDALRPAIQRVWDTHFQVYGPRKVWRQLRRDGVRVARCTVRRLMREIGLVGAVRGRAWVSTTQAPPDAGRLPDLVDRDFTATRPISCGCRTLRTSPRGAVSSMWRL